MERVERQAETANEAEAQLTEVISDWAGSLGLRLRGSLRLAMAETKLAVTTFVMMIFCVVLSAGALMVAWAMILMAIIEGLELAGLERALAIGLLGLAHGALAWLLWRLASRMSRHMEFRATRRLMKH